MVSRRVMTIGFAVLVAGLVFVVLMRHGAEPRYEGRTFGSWFGELCRVCTIYEAGGPAAGDVYPRIYECRSAILEMGTNALPYLMREALEVPGKSTLRELAYRLSMRLPKWSGRGAVPWSGLRTREAQKLIEALRPPAPQLLPLLRVPLASTNEAKRSFAVWLLGCTEDETGAALRILEEVIDQSNDLKLRSIAFQAVMRMAQRSPTSIHSNAIRRIASELPRVASSPRLDGILETLGRIGPAAAKEADAIRPFLQATNDTVRVIAAATLINILPGEPEALEVLQGAAHPKGPGSTSARPWELLCQAAFRIRRTNDWMAALIEPLVRVELASWTSQSATHHEIGALSVVSPQSAAELYRVALQGANPVEAARGLLRIEPTNAVATRILLDEITRSGPRLVSMLSEASSANTEVMAVLRDMRDDPSRPDADRLAARMVLAEIRWREICRAGGLQTN